jgi:tetratricopeptide (TPR) repeat protein
MTKPDQAAFRTALRLTKTDVSEACAAFGDLRANNPSSVTILFNTGLCMERLDELETATQLYDEALAINPRKAEPREGLARIASRLRAEAQRQLHGDALSR